MQAIARATALIIMSPSAELVCVPPDDVFTIWPFVKPQIIQAMRRGGLSGFGPVERGLLANHSLLWLAVRDCKILASAITQIEVTEWRKACVIVACSGKDMDDWLPLIAGIERFARIEQCNCMRILGRKGWIRKLKDYKVAKVVMEKEL